MLRCLPIVDGNRQDFGFGGEGVQVVVVLSREWGLCAEATAVEIDYEGKALSRVSEVWEEESGGDAGFREYCYVFGCDAGERVGPRWNEISADEALNSSVLVDAKKWE